MNERKKLGMPLRIVSAILAMGMQEKMLST
jgi:hypothetical protein